MTQINYGDYEYIEHERKIWALASELKRIDDRDESIPKGRKYVDFYFDHLKKQVRLTVTFNMNIDQEDWGGITSTIDDRHIYIAPEPPPDGMG